MQNFIIAALLALPALASHIPRSLKHREIISNNATNSLEKRGTSRSGVAATYYNVETGNQVACGGFGHNSDWIIAMNTADFAGGKCCGQTVTITWNGKTQHATCKDECPTCAPGGIDLSEDLFASFTSLSVGQIYVSWHLGGSDPAPPPPPPPKPKPKPTHSDPPPPPPSPTPTPTHTTHHTTHHTTSSSSSSSSSSNSASSGSSSNSAGVPSPTGPVVPQGANNVASLFQAYLGVGELAVAALN